MSINTFKRKDYGTWDVFKNSYSRSELLERRAKLAKATNTRIRRLEASKSEITGRSIFNQSHYDVVRIELRREGRRRFSEAKTFKGSDLALRSQIAFLESFLATQTSTVGGARLHETRRIEAFVSKGISEETASSEEFYRFLNSATFNELSYDYLDSEDIIDIYNTAQDAGKSVQEIEKMFESYMQTQSPTRKSAYQALDRLLKGK